MSKKAAAATRVFDVAVIGSGSIGLSTAYYLARNHRVEIESIALVDCGQQPMAFTSAQSGENYRNWWPHPTMVSFTNRSIDLLEELARMTDNRINMNRRGYALATRRTDIDDLVQQLQGGLLVGSSNVEDEKRVVRYHENSEAPSYQRPLRPDWQDVPDGVDILCNRELIQESFPSYSDEIKRIIHIRRGGDISGHQLGMIMLEYLQQQRGTIKQISGSVEAIDHNPGGDCFTLHIQDDSTASSFQISATKMVNAAGPFADNIASMLGVSLPIHNTFQQKIAFEDRERAIPRDMPFSIDLDEQELDWLEDEKELLAKDPDHCWLTERMPGAVHCRPDGGDNGNWVKLGWAYNDREEQASWNQSLDPNFPDVVLRGAARLNPKLKSYLGRLPRNMHHYGGWYTMTKENWPLVGPMGNTVDGAFMNCAMSGFGTMAACAAGELCAAWVAGAELPDYADSLSMKRYRDDALMKQLHTSNKGVL